MDPGFGDEQPRHHHPAPHRQAARYLVVIDAGGSAVVRLYLDTREQVAEFDAGAEEAARMTAGLVPVFGANGPEWDRALAGHSAPERAGAAVYTLAL
jgi:hypothetical protein